MKKLTALALLAISGGAFAFDQYLPVAPSKLETDLEFNYQSITGLYDNGGSKQSITVSPAEYGPALQLKYGIIPGLDAEVYVEYDLYNKDYDKAGTGSSVSGVGRPQLAVKYAHPDFGVGGFLNVALPLGGKDVVGDKPGTQFTFGPLYGKTFGQVAVNAFANYQYNTEDGNKLKQDQIEFYAQGQFNVTPMIGPYLGVDYGQALKAQLDGTSIPHTYANLLTLRPGANITVDDKLAIELTVPVTIMGEAPENGYIPAYWGIYAGVYYTFSL